MITALDFLYVVLAFCAIALTVMAILLGSELLQTVKDVRRIARTIDEIAALLRRVSMVIFPGVQRVAEDAFDIERRVKSFMGRFGRDKNQASDTEEKSAPPPRKKRASSK